MTRRTEDEIKADLYDMSIRTIYNMREMERKKPWWDRQKTEKTLTHLINRINRNERIVREIRSGDYTEGDED